MHATNLSGREVLPQCFWDLVQEGDHTNNYVEVAAPSSDPAMVEMRERLLSEDGQLTASEREKLQAHFGV